MPTSEATSASVEAVEPVYTSDSEEKPMVNGNGNHTEDQDELTSDFTPVNSVSEVASQGDSLSEAEPPKNRLWFVRLPRPAEEAALTLLEAEFEGYQSEYRTINDTFNAKKAERDAARNPLRAARDALRHGKDEYDAKHAEVEKMRAAVGNSTAAQTLKPKFGKLTVHSEAELDTKIADLKRKIATHDDLTSDDEKKLAATIKALEEQRSKVQQYSEALAGLVKASKTEESRYKALVELETQLTILRGEIDVQGTIIAKFREKDTALEEELQYISEERRKLRELRDTAYEKVTEARKAHHRGNEGYYANRSLSQKVRTALAHGRYTEAKAMCGAETEALLTKLSSNAAFRAEYFAAWDQQHRSAGSSQRNTPRSSRDASVDRASKHSASPAVAFKAQQVIQAVLQEAEDEIDRARSVVGMSSTASEAGSEPFVMPKTKTRKPNKKPPVAPSSKSNNTKQTEAVPAIAEFELPEVVVKAQSASDKKLDKEQERQRNKQLMAEAELRRQRREEEKAKKRLKALALAEKHAQLALHNNRSQSETSSEHNDQSLTAAMNNSNSTTPQKPVGRSTKAVAAPLLVAKRPAQRRSLYKQFKMTLNKYEGLIMGIFLLFAFGLMWYLSIETPTE